MDKLRDSSTSSWVFVYGNTNNNENIGKTFHLDCSREPIQELTEQDLSLPTSDVESDKGTDTSDGISIISESEIPFEENCATYSDCLKIEDIHDTHLVENRIACSNLLCIQPIEEHDNELGWKKLFTLLNLLSVVLVISAILVTLHSSLKTREDVAQKEFIIISHDSPGIPSFDEIVDKTIACSCGEKHKEGIETDTIKQCVFNRLKMHDNPIPFDDKQIPAEHMNDKSENQHHEYKHKPEKQQKRFKNEKQSLSGEWYSNMHHYRAELRKINGHKNREHLKAQWYFKRVQSRQRSRQYGNYKAYSD